MSTIELENVLTTAVDLAERAGNELLARRFGGELAVKTKAHENDFVSVADRASEELIVGGLLAARPDDGILGEEGTERSGTSGYRWVIDPLDGTRNYVDGFGPWGVSIALEHEETVLGVIRDPVLGETFTAMKGRGAHCNGRPISVASDRKLGTALVAFSYNPSIEAKQCIGELVKRILPESGDMRRFASAVLQLAHVASGHLDATVAVDVGPWDIAAGSLIAAEAGAWVGGSTGGPATSDFTIAATPEVARELRPLVAQTLDACGWVPRR